ncbi:MAG: hypothetical protein HY319_28100 [Armatimonadetes bacterium]|nr:hypothetical protein [Armatimonadota bacterium]
MLHLLTGIAGLLLVLLAGARLCRSLYGETSGLVLCAAGPATGVALLLVWGALTIPLVGMGASIILFILLCLALVATGRKAALPPVGPPGLAWWEWLYLVAALALVVVYSIFLQSCRLVVEDSFFIHTANIGLMLNGHYPPVNPLGGEMHGHFGRDLLVALLSWLTGSQFLTVDWIAVSGAQALSLVLLFGWLRQDTGSPWQAVLGTGFLFFGANIASYAGLLDILTNNQAVATLAWLLAGYHFFRVLALPASAGVWRGAWLAGAVIGIDALIYEIHFGLIVLAAALLLALSWLLRTIDSRQLKAGWAALLTAVVVSSVVGGPITDLVQTRLGLKARPTVVSESAEVENQHVQLEIPKTQLFQVRLDNLRPSRPFETKFRPWGADFTPTNRYAYVWDRSIVSIFWYPVWLAPFTVAWLLITRSRPGLWFAAFGALGLVVPSLVGFGFFEQETVRWLLMTAFGWSAAFGLMVGWVIEKARGWARTPALLFAAWAIWFGTAGATLEVQEMVAAYCYPGTPVKDGSPGTIPGAGFLPDPVLSLQHHYRMERAEWDAALALRGAAAHGERFLANYLDDPPMRKGHRPEVLTGGRLNVRGTMVGLSGLLPGGITGHPETRLAAPFLSQSLQSRTFWATGDTRRLLPLDVDWLWIREDNLKKEVLARLKSDPGLELLYHERDQWIFRFHQERVAFAAEPCPDRVLRASGPASPSQPFVRQSFVQPVSVSGGGDCWVSVRFRHRDTGEVANALDLILEPLPSGPESRVHELALAAPHVDGPYAIEYRSSESEDWKELGSLEVLSEWLP